MKTPQILCIIVCLLFVVAAAGCTDSKTTPQQNTTPEKAQTVEQTSTTQINVQQTPLSSEKQNTYSESSQNKVVPASSNLTLHVIDIGQGDSLLLTCGTHEMLIDAGDIGKGDDVEKYVKSKGVTSFDYVVATHPHSDHIGGMSVILKDFPISHFISNGDKNQTTETYINMLQTIDDKNIPFQVVHRGEKLNFAPNIDVTVLNPGKTYLTSDSINQNSIVLRVVDGKVAFLLTGDAGIQAEEDIKKDGVNVLADVLKVGHHGSGTATGQVFVDDVKPRVSIVSVGAKNKYHLPDEEPLARLQKVSTLYRTDYNGTVTVTTDGTTYTVTTQNT
jgi:beta-lactamase superfamily II metal-dependent hydrolase